MDGGMGLGRNSEKGPESARPSQQSARPSERIWERMTIAVARRAHVHGAAMRESTSFTVSLGGGVILKHSVFHIISFVVHPLLAAEVFSEPAHQSEV